MAWTSSADLHAQVQRLWDQGVLLHARLGEEPTFPLTLKLKKPGSADLAVHFDLVRQWIRQLQDGAAHYRLAWKEINHRQLGRNQIPERVWIENLDEALAWLGRRHDSDRFSLVATSLERFPELQPWRYALWNRPSTGQRYWRCSAGSRPIPTAICTCANWTFPAWTPSSSSSAAGYSASCLIWTCPRRARIARPVAPFLRASLWPA